MKKNFKKGQEVLLYGTVKRNPYWGIGFEMDNPEYEIIRDDDSVHTNRIVPIYKVTSGLSVRQMRSIMFNIVSTYTHEIKDVLPGKLVQKNALSDLAESILQVHFPDTGQDIQRLNSSASPYHKRLAYDELFMIQLGLAVMKKQNILENGISFKPTDTVLKKFRDLLPFTLTGAQERVFGEILNDMREPYPMNRLIQGDVGCGKTVVALMAMLTAAENGYQSALMAPTEILAEQHFLTIHTMVESLGLNICLLTGSKKERPLDAIASGDINLIVGTHALIQEGVKFKNLGLAVIDEQHRFGVMQRAKLRKKGLNPDVLVMTATPIPRTLSLTLYGDLDYSIIDELPPNRLPVNTMLVPSTNKDKIYTIMKEEIQKGRQVYVVYPLIEESEKMDLRSAIMGKEAFEKIFPEFTLASFTAG